MKKGPIIALVVLLALVGIYFAVKSPPKTKVKAPLAIENVANPSRVEIVKPGDGEQLVVLEKRDGAWALTKPVDAPMDERLAKQLDDALNKKINADDLEVPEAKYDDYELTDEKAYKVAIFSEGASSANVEFQLGKDIRVEGTNAKRAYIKTREGNAYRAQTELAAVLRQDSTKLRSKVILKGDRDKVIEFIVEPPGKPLFKIAKSGTKWELSEPKEPKMELEPAKVAGLVSSLTNLQAVGFEDNGDLKKTGLETPKFIVSWRVSDDNKLQKIKIGSPEKDKYFVQLQGKKSIYEITKSNGKTLALNLLDFRQRAEKQLAEKSFKKIEFSGDEKVVVEKNGDTWAMTRPKKGEIDEAKLKPRIGTFTSLRANTFHDISLEEAGLSKPFATIRITTESGTHVLSLGKEIDERGTRYAKWNDSDYIMSVSKFVTDRSIAKVSDLLKEGT